MADPTATLPAGWTVEHDVPLDSLVEHPRNPRRGDVTRIEQSIRAHGFVDVVVAQTSSRCILHGNHRARVAASLGHTHAPVVLWADVDDATAHRLLLAYNRSADEADYDRALLLEITRDLLADDGGLVGSLYSDEDVDELRRLTGELSTDATDFLADFGKDDIENRRVHEWDPEAAGLDATFTLSFAFNGIERDRVVSVLNLA